MDILARTGESLVISPHGTNKTEVKNYCTKPVEKRVPQKAALKGSLVNWKAVSKGPPWGSVLD